MTGKIKKSDISNLMLELCHFSGSREDILSFIQNSLELSKGYTRVRVQSIEALSSNLLYKNLQTWFSSTDQCIQLFNITDIPKKFNKILGLQPEYKFAIPVRKLLPGQEIIALLILPLFSNDMIQKLQIVAGIAGQKIDLQEIGLRISNYLKYYNIGKISFETFHEIKNKLIAPSTFMQTLPSRHDDLKFREQFGSMALNEIQLIQKQIEKIMQFGRSQKDDGHAIPVSFSQSIKYCLSLIESELNKNKITVNLAVDDAISFTLGSDQMRDILFNLILNSIQALTAKKDKKVINIGTFQHKNKKGFYVEDTGMGMDEKKLARLFEPFFTTKPDGTGLGLSLVKKLINQSHGIIEVSSVPDQGTKFTILFN